MFFLVKFKNYVISDIRMNRCEKQMNKCHTIKDTNI